MRVVSTNTNVDITAAMRVIYETKSGKRRSYSELMGYPADQLTTEYLFPWYNNVGLNSQLRFGNAGAEATTVEVYIGGVLMDSYLLQPNESVQAKYDGVDNGPVRVVSTNASVDITAAMRVIFEPNGKRESYSELMGFPLDQLSSEYFLPVYDNLSANSQIRFGNAGTEVTTVEVYIGDVLMDSYELQPDESVQAKYDGVDNGPVRVVSTNASVNITVAMRMIFEPDGKRVSYSELMGFPADQLTTEYLFPWYNNVNLNSQLRFAVP